MDEYKEYLYKRDPDRYARVSAGDLSYQFYIKERQQCKPFKYFLDVVAPDMKDRFYCNNNSFLFIFHANLLITDIHWKSHQNSLRAL